MAYDDTKYIQAAQQLDEAVWALMENETDPSAIHEMVDYAISNYSP